VLTGHVLVSSVPSLANGILVTDTTDVGEAAWLLLYTPLHVVWAGQEAVMVFFVLSGYVLALPYARGARFSAMSYYPHRLLRLYVPVWGALCLAVLVHLAIEGHGGAGTWWLGEHTQDLTSGQATDSVLLLHGAGTYSLLAVLWSLHWEVAFSLFLPLFLLLGAATRGRFALPMAGLALVLLFFKGAHESAQYLPVFLLGTLMAFQHERIQALRARLAPGARATEAGVLAAAVIGLTANWWLRIGGHGESRLGTVLVGLGACCALLLALVGPAARRALDTRPMQWAGTRSYSLYLVHEPVVVGVAFALGGAPALGPLALLAVPLALALAEAFHRAIERPSHQLARRAGARRRPAAATASAGS
jgi:peptidoglycan/LPS O-acetylase OafA/YrhL